MTSPLHAATFPAIEAIARRYYLRPLTIEPTPGDPDHWSIWVNGKLAKTEIVFADDRYTMRESPARPAPQWDREIPNEKL